MCNAGLGAQVDKGILHLVYMQDLSLGKLKKKLKEIDVSISIPQSLSHIYHSKAGASYRTITFLIAVE